MYGDMMYIVDDPLCGGCVWAELWGTSVANNVYKHV